MSEQRGYYDNFRMGSFARSAFDKCGCRGSGYALSEVDTWHQCPLHYTGQRHPEDFEGERALAVNDPAMVEALAAITPAEINPNDIPF
jgi:hypothetical protein